jgi:hypothetical protein
VFLLLLLLLVLLLLLLLLPLLLLPLVVPLLTLLSKRFMKNKLGFRIWDGQQRSM